ncbi:hypothetical protein [Streptomyces sp. NPDC055055]
MTARTVRPLVATAAAALAVGGLALAGAPSAYAAPGDSGDVNLHRVGTPFDDPDSSLFGVGAAVAAGLAGTAGLVLIRRSRRSDDGAA